MHRSKMGVDLANLENSVPQNGPQEHHNGARGLAKPVEEHLCAEFAVI
jgi:hypothetical protein